MDKRITELINERERLKNSDVICHSFKILVVTSGENIATELISFMLHFLMKSSDISVGNQTITRADLVSLSPKAYDKYSITAVYFSRKASL